MKLTDKVAIVTGASSGIGEATARRLAREGARVVLAARRSDRIRRLAEELGEALAITTDMRDPNGVRALVAAATDVYGGVDVLVNNASLVLSPRPSNDERIQCEALAVRLGGDPAGVCWDFLAVSAVFAERRDELRRCEDWQVLSQAEEVLVACD